MARSSTTLRARYVFPVEGPPIPDGVVTIEDGRIAQVGPASKSKRNVDRDLGNAAIVPGFVNAHTHLELAPLDPRTNGRPDGFAEANGPEDEIDWLTRVVQHRRDTPTESFRTSARENVRAVLRSGTTLVADVTTAGASWEAVAAAPVRGLVFAELVGLKRSRGLETSDAAWDWLGKIGPLSQVRANCRVGLAPHAPYSTSGWLYYRSASSGMPLTTHLAEMPEELELLRTRDGRLRRFLEDLGAWDDKWEPIGANPADYVRRGELRKNDWLIAHGTFLDPADFWQFLPSAADPGHRIAIVYCPRTHARFGHAPHPFLELLQRGVIVCLGTDSLASSPSLSILDEARYLRQRDPKLAGALLLTMATLFGAWALRAETVTGSLKPGKSADLAVIALPDRNADDPHDLLWDSDRPVTESAFEGRFRTWE